MSLAVNFFVRGDCHWVMRHISFCTVHDASYIVGTGLTELETLMSSFNCSTLVCIDIERLIGMGMICKLTYIVYLIGISYKPESGPQSGNHLTFRIYAGDHSIRSKAIIRCCGLVCPHCSVVYSNDVLQKLEYGATVCGTMTDTEGRN